MENTTNPKSFRISDDTHETFKKISAEIGGNQETTLKALLDCYEAQVVKATAPEQAETIDLFIGYVEALKNLFIDKSKYITNQGTLIREEFRKQLESKDDTIADLQSKVTELKERTEKAEADKQTAQEQTERAEKDKAQALKSLEQAEATAKDKTDIVEMLTKQLKEAETKVNEYDTIKAELSKKAEEIATLKLNHMEQISALKEEHSKELIELTENHTQAILELSKPKPRTRKTKEEN